MFIVRNNNFALLIKHFIVGASVLKETLLIRFFAEVSSEALHFSGANISFLMGSSVARILTEK